VSHRLHAALAASCPHTVKASAHSDVPSVALHDRAASGSPRRHSTVGRKRVLSTRQIEIACRYRRWGLPLSFIGRRLHVSSSTVARALQHPDAYKSLPRR
jgi:DNA-binding NarL/FixJ family response regulator